MNTFVNGACDDYEFEVAELVDGTLAPEKARIVSLHLAGCARCRRWRDEYSAMDARLSARCPDLGSPAVSNGSWQRACGRARRTSAPIPAPPRIGNTPT